MVLELRDIQKSYDKGKTYAVREMSIRLAPGVYGLLGPNGAGKSTLMNMITDNLKPDAGSVLLDGQPIGRLGKEYRGLLGYMPQQQGIYEEFSGEMFLWYMAALKGLEKKEAQREIEKVLAIVNLQRDRYKKLKTFSGGMKQRILLAQALLGDPRILILDEPTAGLDPKERIHIRNYISGLARDRIILFATHVVSDIESISDQVLLIRRGELLRMDTPQKLTESIRGKVAEVDCTEQEAEELCTRFKVGAIRQRSGGMTLRIVGADLPEAFRRVQDPDINLEDVYLYYLMAM